MAAPTLHLLTKTPVPGRVKTRLQTRCTAEQAARIATWCIEYTVRLAYSTWDGPVRLHVWPSSVHPLFQKIQREFGIPIELQSDGDLGSKMYYALRSAYPGVVMGCDVPHCPPAVLTRAHQSLNAGRNVIGRSRDGGYYLLGLIFPHRSIFQGLPWGSKSVYAETRTKAAHAGIQLLSLPTLVDLDTWEDIDGVQTTFEPLRRLIRLCIPETRITPPQG